MGKTIDKILNLLQMKNNAKPYSVKFYAEMKLDDGRTIATEDEQFMIGSRVFAVSSDGEAEALGEGEYTMENGNKMSVDSNSKITDLGEEKESEDIEASEEVKEEELAESEAEETDWAKTFEEMKDRVAALEEKVFGKKGEEETEELSKEEKTEMSSEDISELMTEFEELKTKVVELGNEPATESINYNPEGSNMNATVDLTQMSTHERATYYINNK
jgi:hypothetical protein